MGRVKNEMLSSSSSRRDARLSGRSHGAAGQPRQRAELTAIDVRECPPSSNTGGTEAGSLARGFATVAKNEVVSLVLTDTGEVKQVMVRRPANDQCAIIDCVRFTIGEETWCRTAGRTLVGDDEYVVEASLQLERIFGFGITRDLKRPRDFYLNSWDLGDGFGLVCFGGQEQRGTMLVVLHGTGCAAAREGWEARLKDFLVREARRPVITRVDLAHDCFDGRYVNVDVADEWFDIGGFNCSHRTPSHEYKGNWKQPDGSGRSLYIGKRKNGKLCRIYEKGRQLGDASSEWTRVEVEFRNTDRVIPFDVLGNPSSFFVGAYPCLQLISSEMSPVRIDTKVRTAEINVDTCVRHIKRTYGKHLKVLRGIFGDDVLLGKVEADSDEWPERLKVPDYLWSDVPIHRRGGCVPFDEFAVSCDGFTAPDVGSAGGAGAYSCHFH